MTVSPGAVEWIAVGCIGSRLCVELQTSHFGLALKTLALMDRLLEKRSMRFDAAQRQSMLEAR